MGCSGGVTLAGLELFPPFNRDVSAWSHEDVPPSHLHVRKWLMTVISYSLYGSPCIGSFPKLDHSHFTFIANLGEFHPLYSGAGGTLRHREAKPPDQGHTAVKAEPGFEPRSLEL